MNKMRAALGALALIITLSVALVGCVEQDSSVPAPTTAVRELPVQYGYRIINVYPHDPMAFTQGLVWENGYFYEGTGRHGESRLRMVVPETGAVITDYQLPAQYFGEGITLWNDSIIQLTYQSRIGFVYDKETFQLRRTFAYTTEGWGLTHDGRHLIMSDGTATLHFLDPETFEEVMQLEVRDNDTPVTQLNELEFIKGTIYANVWPTDRIVMIAPESGQVVGWIALTGLLSAENRLQPVDVLNGIAYDEATDRLFVTGKLWPKLFEIELEGT
ncbi:MAG: glutaminyl-peptide cyclotransferase [Methanomicrobia archaeon]|nr:glutaminyl-peptide cyclotransferase [Methanomicrobia archaeon]